MPSGFRAPNLAELTSNGVHEGTNRYEVGNSNLKTEQNVQADLNLECKTDHFEFFRKRILQSHQQLYLHFGNGAMISALAIFDYNEITPNYTEAKLDCIFHPHPLDWLHFETSFETVTGEKQNGDYLPLIPANKWNNTIRTEFQIRNWMEDAFTTLNVSNVQPKKGKWI